MVLKRVYVSLWSPPAKSHDGEFCLNLELNYYLVSQRFFLEASGVLVLCLWSSAYRQSKVLSFHILGQSTVIMYWTKMRTIQEPADRDFLEVVLQEVSVDDFHATMQFWGFDGLQN